MVRTVLCSLVVVVAVSGCSTLNYTYPVGDEEKKANPAYGARTCQDIAHRADRSSKWYMTTGIIAGMAAAGMVTAGGYMGPSSDGDNWVERNRGVLTTTGGLLLSPVAVILLMRSDAASTAASSALEAQTLEDDRSKFNACISAQARWIGSRTEATDVALERARKREEETLKRLEEMDDTLKTLRAPQPPGG